MTKMDGNRFKLNLKLWQDRRASLLSQWDDSMWAFEGEEKVGTKELSEQITTAEISIAKLQTMQTTFNLKVMLLWKGKEITLMEAIKAVGGAGRMEKMWSAAARIKKDRYGYSPRETRNKDQEVSVRTISVEDAAKMSTLATRDAGQLRALIAKGNQESVEMDIPTGLLLDEE
jgi:hypothetical protein